MDADDGQSVDASTATTALADPSEPPFSSRSESGLGGLDPPEESVAPLRESQENVVGVIDDQPTSNETPDKK